jgi:hypothetical protein
MILFENFYYDVIKKTYRAAEHMRSEFQAEKHTFVDVGIKLVTTFEDVQYFLRLVFMPPEPVADLASILEVPWRTTVKIKSGESRRRQMPQGNSAIIDMNIANIINKFEVLQKIIVRQIGAGALTYIHKNDGAGYTFDSDTPRDLIVNIAQVFVDSQFFYRELAHEMHHYYDPREHNWMPKVRKQTIQPDALKSNIESKNRITKRQLQKYVNYLASDAELNSAIAETAMHVMRVKDRKELFKTYNPTQFVSQSISFLSEIGKWQQYSPRIKKKVMSKLTLIYNEMRNEQPLKPSNH